MNKQINKEIEEILSTATNEIRILRESSLVGLPSCIQKWIRNSGMIGKSEISKICLKQSVQMKMKPEQKKWQKARAEQYITTEPPAFIWTIKMNLLQVLRIKGRDKFIKGKGEMLIKLNSLFTIGKDSGNKIDEGSLQRYLAEMVWYPSFALSEYISWDEIDPFSAKATMTYNGTTGSGIFHFDSHGNVERFTTLRYKGNNKDKRYEWIATIKAYSIFETIKVPSKMEATWKLDDQDWTWLNLEVLDYKLI